MALTRTSRRLVIVVAAAVVLAILLVIAWFVGERIARETAVERVRSELTTAFQLEPDHPMDIDLGEAAFLPQVIAGSIDSLDVSIDDVPIGPITGSVRFAVSDVPLDENAALGAVAATATVDEAGVAQLGDSLSGIDLDSIELADGVVVANSALSAFGIDVPVSVSLTPSVVSGALAFEPSSFSLNGATLSLDELRDGRFGRFVDGLVPQQEFCVAEYLPQAIVLESAEVRGGELVLGFAGEDLVLGELGATGTCP